MLVIIFFAFLYCTEYKLILEYLEVRTKIYFHGSKYFFIFKGFVMCYKHIITFQL